MWQDFIGWLMMNIGHAFVSSWRIGKQIKKEENVDKNKKCWMGDQLPYWLRLCGRPYRKLLRRQKDRCTSLSVSYTFQEKKVAWNWCIILYTSLKDTSHDCPMPHRFKIHFFYLSPEIWHLAAGFCLGIPFFRALFPG